MMSPTAIQEASVSTVDPVTAAGSMTQAAAGFVSMDTRSSIESAPWTFLPSIAFTAAGLTS